MIDERGQEFAWKVADLAFWHDTKVEFNFTKVDGTDRTIIALPLSMIPSDKRPLSANAQRHEDEPGSPRAVMCVFGEKEQDWRSFRVENINTMKVLL